MTEDWPAAFCAWLLTLTVAHAPAPYAMQRATTQARELAWVGLFNGELVGWLENENRLAELCTAREGSHEWHECRASKLEPKLTVIPVRAAPEAGARRLGEIVVVALPGQGLKAFAAAGSLAAQFTPDLFDQDWGYGPWFHQTILTRRGSWFRVPVSAIGPGWINAAEWSTPGADSGVKTVEAGDIIITPRGDMFVLGVGEHVLRVRPEQKSDMWCQAGDPPPLAPWQEIRIPFDELFDAKDHLLIRYKYTRGC